MIVVNDDGICVIGWMSCGGSFEGIVVQVYLGCGQVGGGQIELMVGSNFCILNIVVDEDGCVIVLFVVDDVVEGDGGISLVVCSNVV